MAKHKNTVWDSTAGAYVAWLTDDDYDPAGASYPGPGTYGVDTSQYRRGEVYDAVIASATDDTAVHTDIAAEISAVTEKGTPVSGDVILIEDSADSSNKKKIQVGNLPGGSGTDADAIHDNVAGEIASITAKATPTTSDYLVIEDAGDANSKKSITVGDLPASAPASHASSHDSGGGDALAIDAAAGTGSLRTLGTASTAACAGDDSRLSDSRAPTSHASSHDSGGGDAMAIDAAAGTGSLRTLGTSATAACAGNDSRLSDARTPSSHASSHDAGGGDALAIDAVAGTGSLRTLGTSATSACAGNDSRLSDNRTDGDAIHDNAASEISAITEKGTPVSADLLIIEDSADSNNKKKVQVGNLPGGSGTDSDAIHDNVAGEIAAITAKGTPTTSDYLVIEDAADSNNKKSITLGDLPAAAPASHATSHEDGGGDVIAHQDLSGAGTNDHSTIDTHLASSANPHTVTATQVGNTTAQWNADELQGTDIDASLAPTDGQVLTYDNGSSHWTASAPAEHTSYRELATNKIYTQSTGSPETTDVGEGVFDAGQHNSVTLRATLTVSWATTGTMTVKLWDDGPTSAPGTPRTVSTFTKTTDGGYEVFEQALTIVSSSPSTNEILGSARVYRIELTIDGAASDVAYIGSAGLVGVGNGDNITLNADVVQAIAMSLNA